ncbi:glycine cleavage H-protein, partial [Lactarius deliciosus]
ALCAPASYSLRRTVVTKLYTTDHEVIKFDDETGVGTKSLGDVVFVELPEKGVTIEQGEPYAPVSGDVVRINEELEGQPSLLNKSPEDDGWLFQLKLSKREELEGLLSADAYKKHCES